MLCGISNKKKLKRIEQPTLYYFSKSRIEIEKNMDYLFSKHHSGCVDCSSSFILIQSLLFLYITIKKMRQRIILLVIRLQTGDTTISPEKRKEKSLGHYG